MKVARVFFTLCMFFFTKLRVNKLYYSYDE